MTRQLSSSENMAVLDNGRVSHAYRAGELIGAGGLSIGVDCGVEGARWVLRHQ